MKRSKVIRIGNGPDGNVYCNIVTDLKEKGLCLSITGVEGPYKNGNAKGSCGQIYDSIRITKFAPGWSKETLNTFVSYWKEWHLNDMQAGCEHQIDLGWTSCDDHPSEPCPVCGYKFGTKWLFKEVPKHVIEWLFKLPDTDKEPAWI